MNDDRFQQVNEIFVRVCAAAPDAREQLIDELVDGDADLASEVRALLAIDGSIPTFLDDDAVGQNAQRRFEQATRRAATSTIRPSTKIKQYEIIDVLGEGGMGVVYRARQTEPMTRTVALKVIKPGMDSASVIARFEAERQALAVMDHAGIAKVIDGGTTESGLPFFVMELVKGEPITDFCDRHRLDIVRRLNLMIDVCKAVQHAHSKGVIHRDLKPSNVMVGYDGEGNACVKVIDFGVAKALDNRLGRRTLFTNRGQLIGTPEYMSPEQAEMSGTDIDTRSDVYSLGVLLYELLTGTTPFDSAHFRSAAFGEIQRIIREETPAKPSTRLSTLEALPSVAEHRHTEPRRLDSLIRGDLDWIVMMALEKDRTRRYETANGLAADIRRYLDNEPVVASPPSTAYRIRKFVRRNRAGVTAASLVAAVLVLGAAGTTYGMFRSMRSERKATDATSAALVSAERAERERDIARAVNEFLNDDLLEAVAPSNEEGRGHDVLMRDVLDAAAARIDAASQPGQKFADKPAVEASIRSTLASTYRLLGEYDRAVPHARRALQLALQHVGLDHPDTLRDMNSLAILLDFQNRHAEAERLHRESLARHQKVLGAEHPETLNSMNNLAIALDHQGRYSDAAEYYRKALDAQTQILGATHADSLGTAMNLAAAYSKQGKYEEAEQLHRSLLETMKQVLGEDDPQTLNSASLLAGLLVARGQYGEAASLFTSTLKARQRILGPNHPRTLGSMDDLAGVFHKQGKYEAAEELLATCIPAIRRELGDTHSRTLSAITTLAHVYKDTGRIDEAEALFVEALEGAERIFDGPNPETAAAMDNLAGVYMTQGRYGEAVPLYRQALEARQQFLGPEHVSTLNSMNNLAAAFERLGRSAEALPLFAQVLDGRRATLGNDHPLTLAAANNLAISVNGLGRYDEARTLHEQTLAARRRVLGNDHPQTLGSMNSLANTYSDLGMFEDAEAIFAELIESRKRVLGPDHPETLSAMNNLANVLTDQNRYKDAESIYLQIIEGFRRSVGDDHPRTVSTRGNLAILYGYDHQFEKALPMFEELVVIAPRVFGPVHPWVRDYQEGLATCYANLGRNDDAIAVFGELLAAEVKSAEAADANASVLHAVAAKLLTHHYEELRDPTRAESFAARAAAITAETDPNILNTLARAQRLNNKSAQAAATLQKAIELLSDEDPMRAQLEARLAELVSESDGGSQDEVDGAEPLLQPVSN